MMKQQEQTSQILQIQTGPTGYGADRYEYVTGYPRLTDPYNCCCR